MSRRNKDKGRLAPFVPMLKDTMKTEAWKALSHGARSLYAALKGRYNSRLQNAVYLSIRVAQKELGSFSRRDNVGRWFHELKYYGFIVMESGACLGVEGRGKAPHYRLTEEWYLGKAPTRDFLNWDGEVFHEQKSPRYYTRKKQNPVPAGEDSLSRQVRTVNGRSKPNGHKSVPAGEAIHCNGTVPHGEAITSLTTPCAAPVLPCAPAAIPVPDNPWPVYRAMRGLWQDEIYFGSIVRLCGDAVAVA